MKVYTLNEVSYGVVRGLPIGGLTGQSVYLNREDANEIFSNFKPQEWAKENGFELVDVEYAIDYIFMQLRTNQGDFCRQISICERESE